MENTNLKRTIWFLLCYYMIAAPLYAQEAYPYPAHYINLKIETQEVRMAYMDVLPRKANHKTVLLLHGKNFNGYYWKDIAAWLAAKGYRVIVPDQVGWGKSEKPLVDYNFQMLAANTKALLDSLQISRISVIGHSMGGMLAARYTLMYPGTVDKLVLENPIGLEDYRLFVVPTATEEQYHLEKNASYESYKKYMQGYFPVWKPEYEELVRQQAAALEKPGFDRVARVNALTYNMIYSQPVADELKNVKAPTLLIIGQEDRTIVGKDKMHPDSISKHGKYTLLGKVAHKDIRGSKLVELEGVGHIPHIQVPEVFKKEVAAFLD